MIKKVIVLLFACLLIGTVIGWANPGVPKGLIDSKPDQAVLANFNNWYALNAAPNDPKIVSETIFSSPRALVMLRDAGKGFIAGRHYHATADEIVIVTGGSGELLINGEWISVKAGDIHANPRGNIHDTRVLGGEDLQFISVFTPPQPEGSDVNRLKDDESVTIAKGLVDSKPGTAVLVNFDQWYAYNSGDAAKIVSETIFTSPRSIVMLRAAKAGTVIDTHYHSTCDEIVVITGGSGEMLINGKWVAVKAGDIHVNPRGIIHATRATGENDLKFISIFTPPQPAGGDMNFLK